MSKIMRRSDRKPPLPKSPVRAIGSRRSTHSSPAAVIKTPLANRSSNVAVELRPEYHQTISCEFQALAKMVQDEFSKPIVRRTSVENPNGSLSNPCFERGRLYDEYSARRNERLKRKRGQNEEDDKENQIVSEIEYKVESAMKTASKRREVAKNQFVSETEFKVESAMKTASKRREVAKNQIESEIEFKVESAIKTSKKREVAKRSVVSTPVAENPAGTSRYMLRSRDKKPPLPVKYEESAVKKTVTRRARKL